MATHDLARVIAEHRPPTVRTGAAVSKHTLALARIFSDVHTLKLSRLQDEDRTADGFFDALHTSLGMRLVTLQVADFCSRRHCHEFFRHTWLVLENVDLTNEGVLDDPRMFAHLLSPVLRRWSIYTLDGRQCGVDTLLAFWSLHSSTLQAVSTAYWSAFSRDDELLLWRSLPHVAPHAICPR
jgi:hypothetical protein